MTYEQAVDKQWVIAYHRIAFAKENHRPCDCEECQEHFAAIEAHEAVSQEAQ